VKSTPLSVAIEFERSSLQDVNILIKSLAEQQEMNNLIKGIPDLICSEAFDPLIRKKCINQIFELVTNNHQLMRVS